MNSLSDDLIFCICARLGNVKDIRRLSQVAKVFGRVMKERRLLVKANLPVRRDTFCKLYKALPVNQAHVRAQGEIRTHMVCRTCGSILDASIESIRVVHKPCLLIPELAIRGTGMNPAYNAVYYKGVTSEKVFASDWELVPMAEKVPRPTVPPYV
jgi:hypothetical protein